MWLRYVSGLRRSWGAWTVLAAVCGGTLSLAMAAAGDARRTSTALERNLGAHRAPDAAVAVDQSLYSAELVTRLMAEVDRLPQVSAAARVEGVFLEVIDDHGGFVPAFDFGSAVGKLVDERAVRDVGAFHVISGRLPAADQPDEVMVNPEAIAAGGWAIGDEVASIRLFRPSDLDEQGEVDPTGGEQLHVTIVGVARRPDELIDDTEGRAPQVYLFPAFEREHGEVGYYLIDYVRLRNGSADEGTFQKGAAAISSSTAEDPLQYSSFTDAFRHAEQAQRPQVVAIWLLAAVLLAVGMLFSAQAVLRALASHYDDVPVLRVLGVSRRGISVSIAMHATTIAVGAAMVAVAGGYVSSVVTPFGATAELEPDPGLRLDGIVLMSGAAIVVLFLAAVSLWWGWRAASRITHGSLDGTDEPVPAAHQVYIPLIGRVRSGPLSSTALRFTFGRSSARTSAAARAITGAAAVGIALFTGALAFASSLDTVLRTPKAYGWNWDVALLNSFGAIPDDALASVIDDAEVDESTAFTTGSITVAGHRVSALGIGQQSGALFLTLTSGRPPQSADEIVLGAATLRTSGKSIGDQVDVVTAQRTRSMTIVGVATFPAIGSARFGSLSLGDGAATIASVLPSTDPTGTYNGVLLRLVPGRSRIDQIAALRRVVGELGCTDASCFLVDAPPPQLAGYDDLRSIWLPFSFAIGGLIAVPLGFGIISTTRDRRRDLAVLRALGMTHRQVSTVLILYATVTGVISAAIGVVLGVLTAKVGWRLFSRSVDINWPIDLPALQFAVVAIGATLISISIAIVVLLTPISRRTMSLR